MQVPSEKKMVLGGLLLAGLIFSLLAFLTPVPAGGADNYAHFNIARWAFRYPYLFLDHWGKPLYTLLAAPFAQYGFTHVRILNSLLGLLTAWYIWKLARLLRFEHAWFSAVLAVFTPMYFVMMSTGMTEILFSLILIVSIYLFFKEEYIISAVAVSFLFLARTEGLAFELLFLFGFLLKKEWKAVPFLATGFVVFSLIGLVYHYHDFWWLITERPYAKGGASVYGSGNWYHFFQFMPEYLGQIIRILLFAGSLFLIVEWIISEKKFQSQPFYLILLVLGAFWGYFFIHSYLWWKGETSAGLTRVMAGATPLIGIIALSFLRFIDKFIKNKKITTAILLVLSGILIFQSAKFYYRSASYDPAMKVKNEVTNWLRESGELRHKLVMHDPYFAFSTEIDAWDQNIVQYGFSNNDTPETGLPDSALFIWDAHFSANEGRLAFSEIAENRNFEVVKLFEPETPFKVLGNNDYRIVVFRKTSNAGKDNYAILQQLKNEELEKGIFRVERFDFESAYSEADMERRRVESDSTGFAFSLEETEFSPAFVIPADGLDLENKIVFRISAEFRKFSEMEQNRLLMVFSVESNQKSDHYETRDIAEQIEENGVWENTEFIFNLPEKNKGNSIIKIYVWNIDKAEVLMDNFTLEISKQTKSR